MKRIAILQSSYIPWKGYFDIINSVDEFVLYDDVQYTRRDWRNRNKIKTPDGLKWLTIPVMSKGNFYELINKIQIVDQNWRKIHWDIITRCYKKSKYFNLYAEQFKNLYYDMDDIHLSKINYKFICLINSILSIPTKIKWSTDYPSSGHKSIKLLDICEQAEASEYLSGPAAKSYIDQDLFRDKKIKLLWMDYKNYPTYNQLYSPFVHTVSIIDLIFNEGINATRYMKSFSSDKKIFLL